METKVRFFLARFGDRDIEIVQDDLLVIQKFYIHRFRIAVFLFEVCDILIGRMLRVIAHDAFAELYLFVPSAADTPMAIIMIAIAVSSAFMLLTSL